MGFVLTGKLSGCSIPLSGWSRADFSAVLISFRFRRTGLNLSGSEFFRSLLSVRCLSFHSRYFFGFPQLPEDFSVSSSVPLFLFGLGLPCYCLHNIISLVGVNKNLH